MTIEKFLSFWNQHNVIIIEGLLGVIVVLSLAQAYRLFFGKKSAESEGSSSLDAVQIEKTLQKILEAQHGGKGSRASTSSSEEMGVDVDLNGMDDSSEGEGGKKAAPVSVSGEVPEEVAQELAQLKQVIADRQKQVETLQAEVKKAQEAAAVAPAPSDSGEGAGISTEEKSAFDEKIRDLEARLAEYEIISEDIADLSKYKEENESLKAQIEALRSSGGAAPATPAEESTAPVEGVVQTSSSEPEPEPEPAQDQAADQAAADADVAALVNEIQPPPSEEPSSDLIDDELMKEFAMAVEGQKALEQAADKAGPGDKAATKTDETEKLLGEFENFVNKKS